MTAFGDTAAVLGADFYDMVRDLPPSAGTVQAVLAQPAKVKQSEGVVRWAVGPLFVGEWDQFESSLLGASQRLVLQPARETIDLLAQADARAGKADAVGWSRQVQPGRAASGESCDFCLMLAGRGPVYGSAASAGGSRGDHPQAAEWHDRCNCVAVPTFYRREMQSRTERGFTRQVPTLVPMA